MFPTPRLTLAGLLMAVAVLALALSFATPGLRRAFGRPDSWDVRTVTLPEGKVVRRRIRRHPDRDVVYDEILPGAKGRDLPTPLTGNPTIAPRKTTTKDPSPTILLPE